MKQIQILHSNNVLLDSRILTFAIPESDKLNDLMTFICQSVTLSNLSEVEIFLEIMKWVNQQLQHDGLNDAGNLSSLEILKRAANGETFRCVEFAKVTKDILLSLGYIARTLNVQSQKADYGGFGQGHVVVEVWSNTLQKWIFLDPQLCCYAIKGNLPLSYYEVYHSFNEITFVLLNPLSEINEQMYREFITQYFGYLKVNSTLNGIQTELFLHLESERQLLAFQGLGLSNGVFTKNVEDVYFNPNQTTILFEYKEAVNVNQIIQENNLTTEEDLINNFHLFHSKPDYKLTFVTNTPNHDYYELKINETQPINITEHTYNWRLNDGINTIKICSVNKQGVKGSYTEMSILYN